ncbi:MAG: tetratricopeptide repeat protein, partial [Verrucomicrobia bacterium]|nr:tetratricopeptide repeat protein [Verrucomicrobiota bacterium]
LAKTNQAKEAAILQGLLNSNPGDPVLLDRAKVAFAQLRSYTNAIHATDQQLQLAPDNPDGLLQKGLLCVQAGEFSNAIPTLTRLLSLTNTYAGRMSRAQAYAQSGQWDAATADYQTTLRLVPAAYQPFYGLAEVARSKGDTNAAIGYYQQYLSRAPTNQFEFRAVMARLQSLQPRAP